MRAATTPGMSEKQEMPHLKETVARGLWTAGC